MGKVEIIKESITKLDVDAIVNAANENLLAGGGVCGAIFDEAGHGVLQDACDKIGYCKTGNAVATPGFNLKARYVIHAVGPRWLGGTQGEPELLASCYEQSLECACELGCTSIAFPLISSGIFGYPKEDAWKVALSTCSTWLSDHPSYSPKIFSCVLSDDAFELGQSVLNTLLKKELRVLG